MSWEDVRLEIARNKNLRLSDWEQYLCHLPALERAWVVGVLSLDTALLVAALLFGGPLWFRALLFVCLLVIIPIVRREFLRRELRAEFVVRRIFMSLLDRVKTDSQLYDERGEKIGRFDFVSNAVFVKLNDEPCGYWRLFESFGPDEVLGWIEILGPVGESETNDKYSFITE